MKRNNKWITWLMIVVLLLNSTVLGAGTIRASGVPDTNQSNNTDRNPGVTETANGSFLLMATSSIIYVKKGADGDGSSWNQALGTLQDALDIAEADDEIWIAAGTYTPTKDRLGNAAPTNLRTLTFQMKNGVTIYGGFPSNAADGMDMDARNWETNKTILSGDLEQDDTDDLSVNKSDNAYHVFYHPFTLGLDETAIMDGVTITGGYNTSTSYPGAGIRNDGNSSEQSNSPTIRNVIITGNVSGGNGGGLYNAYGSPTLTNVTISNNQGAAGGGIYTHRGELIFVDGSIANNTATGSGGGLAVNNGSGTTNQKYGAQLTRVNISDNNAKITNAHNGPGGGGIYLNFGILKLTDLDITNNQTGSSGGGISGLSGPYEEENAFHLELVGVNILNNTAGLDGGGIATRHKGTLSIAGGEISDNRTIALRSGGGINNAGADMTLEDVVIRGNEAHSGGGIALSSAEGTLTNVALLENSGVHGGGLHIGASSPILTNVIIQGNLAQGPNGNFQGSGGGIYNNSDNNGIGQPVLRNVLITGNVAEGMSTNGHGGGIYDRGGAFSTLMNVTLSHNYSNGDGGGYYREGGANSLPEIHNSIIWGNKAEISASDSIKNAFTAAGKTSLHIANSIIEDAFNLDEEWNTEYGTNDGGNLGDDPEFIAPVTATLIPSILGDYRLGEFSLAIDRGDNTKVEADVTTDLAGGPRITGDIVDLGAFELNMDNEAPTWPAGMDELTIAAVPGTPTSVTVSWPEAEDNVGVTSYYLTMDDRQPLAFPGNIFANTAMFEYTVEDLPEPKVYTFKLIAVDASGNESSALIGVYELQEEDIEPPAPGTFAVNWSIARSAYPYMLALPEAPLEMTAIGDAGQTLEAIIHYESWFEQDGTALTVPRMLTDTVNLSEDQANPGRYNTETQLPDNVGRITSIDVIATNVGQQTIVSKPVDLLVAASFTITNAQTSLGSHLNGSTMMLWSDEAGQGSTNKVSGLDTYTFTGIIPHNEYVFRFMEAVTNRPLRDGELLTFLPGEALFEDKTITAPATLRVGMTFAGGETAVPDDLIVVIKDSKADQIISTKLTDSSQAWTRPASGKMLFAEDELQLQIAGLEWPYVAKQVKDIILTAGINDVNIDINYADRAFIEGTVELNVPDGQLLEGIQVTAVQTHPGFSHRSFISKALTDQDGKYRLEVIADIDAVLQVAGPVKDTISPKILELDKGELTVDTTVIKDFIVEPYPGPAIVRAKITATYIEGQSSQVWESEQIDWRTAVHFRLSAKDASGRSYSQGYPLYVNAGIGESIHLCVDGYEGDLPKQCVEAIVEYSSEGEVFALGTFDLVQTGGIAKGNVVDGLTGEPVDNWSGSLYLKKDGKLQSVNRNQHGIANRTRSSEIKLWLPEAGTYELRLSSGNKSYVREVTVTEGQIIELDQLQLTTSGIFAGQANNELRIVESELVQGGKVNVRAVYTNNGSSAVDGAEIKIALPHGTTYVTDSAVLNNKVPTANEIEIDDGFVLFKIGNIKAGGTGVVLFQLKADAAASLSDEIGTTAVIRYNQDGAQREEVFGVANVPVVQVSLNAPTHTVNRDVMLYGSAPAGSKVDVYVEELLLGRSIASPTGSWSMEVELPDHHGPAVYVLQALAEVGSQLLSSGNVYALYNETYPHLTEMSMQQRDGRKITVDPRAGVAYFPFVTADGSYTYEMTFNNPDLVSNVWVRMGPENALREAKAVRDLDGTFRAVVISPPNGPVYVDFDTDIDKLPTELGQTSAYDWVSHHYSIQETVLGTIEEDLLAAATPKQVTVQGETFSWSYAERENVSLTEEMLNRLVPITVNGKQYYTEKLSFTDNGDGFVMRVYGEDLDELQLIDEEIIATFSSLSSNKLGMSVQPFSVGTTSTKKFLEFVEGFWKVTKETSGPIRDVNNDSTSFDDAFQAFSDMVTEAAAICDPILRVDAQRTLQRMRDERILAYELKVLVLAAPLNILGGIIIDNVKNAVYAEQVKLGRQLLDMWLQNNKCEKKPLGTKALDPKFIHDPSGYVYEAVESNRIEGVQATLLYQDPDANNEWIVWDAEWYLQKNPHWTDANGRYGWDVPEGMWQVVYEKEGYETAYSQDIYGEIKVLPPHFDVNIPMITYQSPEVAKVESKSNGKYLDITFSRYMALNTFSESTVLVETVCATGQTICTSESITGTLTGVLVELGVDGRDLARTIRFTPDNVMSVGDTITLTVHSIVQSYAGVPMEDLYTKDIMIEKIPVNPIDPEDPVKPVHPNYPTDPVDPKSPPVTDDGYPIDPTIDQTITVDNGKLVIHIPAGAIGGKVHNIRMHVEAIEGTKYPQSQGYISLNPPFQISFTNEDEAGKKTTTVDLLKPIKVSIKLDGTQLGSVNPGKVTAFILEEGSWRYIQGAFDPQTNQHVMSLKQPGIIAVMLTDKTFPDISGHWAQEIIEVMSGRGIIAGRSNNTFAPEALITRAEYVALLTRVLHIRALPEATSGFADVAKGEWYHGIIAAALSDQLIAGISETRFGPNLSITREQISVLLQRAYAKVLASQGKSAPNVLDSALTSYLDAGQVSSWAQDGMNFALQYGIIKGRGKEILAPQAMASRAEAAVMLQRFMDIMWNEINKKQ